MGIAGQSNVGGEARKLTRRIVSAFSLLSALVVAWTGLPGARAQNLPGGNGPSGASDGPGSKRRMISLVVLSDDYVQITANSLSKKLDELYPGKFWPLHQQANFVADGPTPGQFLIKSTIPGAAGLFMLLSAPAPYTEFSDFARFIADPALRHVAEAQRCWLSVDLVHNITSEEEAYRFIGAALAKLAPADAAVLVRPEDNSTIRFDEKLRQRLAAGQFMP
jgi:hypothetical protein